MRPSSLSLRTWVFHHKRSKPSCSARSPAHRRALADEAQGGGSPGAVTRGAIEPRQPRPHGVELVRSQQRLATRRACIGAGHVKPHPIQAPLRVGRRVRRQRRRRGLVPRSSGVRIGHLGGIDRLDGLDGQLADAGAQPPAGFHGRSFPPSEGGVDTARFDAVEDGPVQEHVRRPVNRTRAAAACSGRRVVRATRSSARPVRTPHGSGRSPSRSASTGRAANPVPSSDP